MKPIFDEEREFLKKKGILIPKYCWRKSGNIFINSKDNIPALVFQVDGIEEKIIIKKNLIDKVDGDLVTLKGVYRNRKVDLTIRNKSFNEEAEENSERLNKLVEQTVKMTSDYINERPDYEVRVSISGGKDSSVMNHIFKNKILKNIGDRYYKYNAFNTTNEVGDTYRQMYKEGVRKCDINNPRIKGQPMGWYQWIEKEKNYWIPNSLKRSCCSTFKEGQLKYVMDKNKKYITLLGVRKYESVKREFYEFDINRAYIEHPTKKLLGPKEWKKIAPICYWTDEDIWYYIILNNLEINKLYYLGFHRCGCLICPFNSPYTNLLIKENYPKMWERWVRILEKNYETKRIGKRLKWSKKEWCGGKWKTGISKEGELISLKKTEERVKEMAKIKNISYELAEKYWENKCSICSKKINPHEIAMNLKVYGRGMDTKHFQCKKCFCDFNKIDKNKYAQMVFDFISDDCNLF